jgi:hypothetical protein
MAGKNYAAGVPMGNNQGYLQGLPAPFKAVKQYLSENATASSVVTLTENTTAIEVAAQTAPVALRWVYVADGTTAATSVIAVAGSTANFDHIVPANTYRRFVVPIETGPTGVAPNASAVGANIENGLFRRLAYKTQGIASVAVTEYGSSNSY